ncbi:MAG: hypothetical protein JW809_07805 [Pirellulales bacterium]|nr:hypothetical protein [Pirellulales bacterium]
MPSEAKHLGMRNADEILRFAQDDPQHPIRRRTAMADKTDRRCFLARGVLGAVGAGAVLGSVEERTLQAALADGAARPSQGEPAQPVTDIPPGSLPLGKIGGVALSRLFIGGNLIGGWAHSRDLMYGSRLFQKYNTEAKVFETLDLALACGVNTIQLDPACWGPVTKYNQSRQTKIQTMVCVPLASDKNEMNDAIRRQIDLGATFVYSHGGVTDTHMMNGGGVDAIGQMLDLIKAQGVPAGVGGHSLNMPIECEKAKLPVDYYVKTFHGDRYWSATPVAGREEYDWMRINPDHDKNHDNMWCNNPEETAAFMEKVEKPWVAFKVMAAGAIPPRVAFRDAYRNGADFIIAGMFDFQIEEDVKIAIDDVRRTRKRKRPWHG